MTQADDERFLHRGWDWLEGYADHDPRPENYDALDAEWYRRLHLYEEAYRLVNEPIQRGIPPKTASHPASAKSGDLRRPRDGTTGVDVLRPTETARQSSF